MRLLLLHRFCVGLMRSRLVGLAGIRLCPMMSGTTTQVTRSVSPG